MNRAMRFALAALTATAAIAAPARAHDLTDWRTDLNAFRTAYPAPRPDPGRIRVWEYPDFPVDPAYLRDKLAGLSGAAPVVIGGKQVVIAERSSPAARELARQLLAQEYTALGFKVAVQTFSSGANFIAEKTGADPSQVLILSTHLDSVGNAGANDDGMGTVAALAIARALAPLQLRYNFRVVGFDREEEGLIGSRAYAHALPAGQKVLGDIQMEMLGTNRRHDGAFHSIDCDRPGSRELTAEIMNAVTALKLPLKRVAACTNRSDHAAFWEVGLPAIVLSENFFGGDGDPCYHASCDRLDARIDFDYAARITQAIGSAVAHLLEARR